MAQPPELTGGGGFTFEDSVVAYYLSSLLSEESAPGLLGAVVQRVAVQQAAFGQPLDDLVIDGARSGGQRVRVALQAKRELVISAGKANTDFREVVLRSWETLQLPEFHLDVDRVGAAIGTVSENSRRALVEIAEWARASEDADLFFARFDVPGYAGAARQNALDAVVSVLSTHSTCANPRVAAFNLLRHFVLIKLDLLHAAAVDETHVIERLRALLATAQSDQAPSLWYTIRTLARDGAGRSATFTRSSLLQQLQGSFRLAGRRSLHEALQAVRSEAQRSIETIPVDVDGTRVGRDSLLATANRALETHRFINISGLPGTGKSVVLRALAEEQLARGPILLLKSDRLLGTSWASYATAVGIKAWNVRDLLREIGAAGSPILFVDGIDRIEVAQRGVILDLINEIVGSSSLSSWKIVATSRDSGIEPLRTWLPSALFTSGGVGTVSVAGFDDEEAERLATVKPALRPLLFGDERVREVARRPFFANVLARSLSGGPTPRPPRSEIELVEAWWVRGGYNADARQAAHRQRALLQLARSGARALGRRMRIYNMDLDALDELKKDGIVKDLEVGHSVSFAHDIFFEWSLLHLLIDRDDEWLEEIRSIGEPPALGRTVELLSQSQFASPIRWQKSLSSVELSPIRPQWTRAWLLGPFGTPTFDENRTTIEQVVGRGHDERLQKLFVWFQAEKTAANPLVLQRAENPAEGSRAQIIRIADALAWPSDYPSWRRLCGWALSRLGDIPVKILPDLLSAFEVWQNALCSVANPISAGIISAVSNWLQEIEDVRYSEEFRHDWGRWNELPDGELEEFEERLRTLLLLSVNVETDRVRAYIDRVNRRRRLRDHAFKQVVLLTPRLASRAAVQLVNLTLTHLLDELPADVAARPIDRHHWPHSFSFHDWEALGLRRGTNSYFPASPLREPFKSLFEAAPDHARELVRRLANHAILAWRQLFGLDPRRPGTPLPLTLEFPSGTQVFWGDGRVYLWARGHWGPSPVVSGLMALEEWAFKEIEQGKDTDEVIQKVLEGHESCSVLCIANAIALTRTQVSATTLPLAVSQLLWDWDISRSVQDGPKQPNEIGFISTSDLEHAKAVRASNERPARTLDIRALAQFFVLGRDKELREAAQDAIASFPSNLPLSFEEERGDAEHLASLRRRAEIWAELGHAENYVLTPSEDGTKVYVQHQNPRSSEPDVKAAAEKYERMSGQLALLNWILGSFEQQQLSKRLTLSDAIERARSRDRDELFSRPHRSSTDDGMDQSVVAGVAAVSILYGGELHERDLAWADGVLCRAGGTGDDESELLFHGSKLLHHPCLFAARGLRGVIARGAANLNARECLLRLIAHPLDEVSVAAAGSALSLFDVDASFALIAFELALQMSIRVMNRSDDANEVATNEARIAAAVESALVGLNSGQVRIRVQSLPAPWAYPRRARGRRRQDRRNDTPGWVEPETYLRWDFLPKVLNQIPAQEMMQNARCRPVLLAFSDDLLRWVVGRVNPAGSDPNKADRTTTDVLKLIGSAGRFWAQVALAIGAGEARTRILAPMFALDHEAAICVIRPFVEFVSLQGVVDAAEISNDALEIMQSCLERVMEHPGWKHAQRGRGELLGFDLPELVRIFLFISVESAGGAARFANGDWKEIGAVLPVVDPFVRTRGSIPYVTSSFLTLCEKCAEYYPAEIFVDQITEILAAQAGTPVGWRHTTIPARIAALIHALAERSQPLDLDLAQKMLRLLDRLVDMGDRRSAGLQTSEIFKDIKITSS